MKHLSLTARMSLMFMSAVIAVLTVAGLSFNMLSQHHFKMLDRQVNGLPFWENGVKFFTIEGPNKEKIEFCEKL